jgi:hypothetical protein
MQMLSSTHIDYWISGAGSRVMPSPVGEKYEHAGSAPELLFVNSKEGGFLSFKVNAAASEFVGHFVGTSGKVLFEKKTPFRRN